MGTSSSLFNALLTGVNSTSLPNMLGDILRAVLSPLGLSNEDIADYNPNPFYHYNSVTNPSANSSTLTLVDGGEDLENIPFHPLIQPLRKVDVIFAVDSSADTTYKWPNATALVATYQRALSGMSNGIGFPSVPDQNTIVNLGLNTHPTFFGCNASNITSTHPVPLIVYLPNAPYVTYSNVSTFTPTYNNTFRDAIILNGYDVATMGNGTVDSEWPMCVGCAILSRSFGRTGTTAPAACTRCFSRYCWNGTVDSRTPSAEYAPTAVLGAVKLATSRAGRASSRPISLAVALGVATTFASL